MYSTFYLAFLTFVHQLILLAKKPKVKRKKLKLSLKQLINSSRKNTYKIRLYKNTKLAIQLFVHLITKSLLRSYLTRINFNFGLILLNEICFLNSLYSFFILEFIFFIWIRSAHCKFFNNQKVCNI